MDVDADANVSRDLVDVEAAYEDDIAVEGLVTAVAEAVVELMPDVVLDTTLETASTFRKSSMAFPPPHNCLESPAQAIVHPVDESPAPPAVFNVFPHQHSFPY